MSASIVRSVWARSGGIDGSSVTALEAIAAYQSAVGWSSSPEATAFAEALLDQGQRAGLGGRQGRSGDGENGDERRDEECATAGHTEAETG